MGNWEFWEGDLERNNLSLNKEYVWFYVNVWYFEGLLKYDIN